jgi:hypothetical protein
MWTKYTYLCTDCDALIEVTANIFAMDPTCICAGQGVIVLLSEEDGNAPKLSDVMSITPPKLVKINTNPYT